MSSPSYSVTSHKIKLNSSSTKIVTEGPSETPVSLHQCHAPEDSYVGTHHLVKVKVKFTLEQTTKAQRGRRDIVLLFL
jgi:hypothetical protein